MNTKLIFTRNSPLRTTIVNESNNRPLYKVETPRQVTRKVTRIRRVPQTEDLKPLIFSDDDDDASASDDSHPAKGESAPPEEEEIPSGSDELARIYWHHISHNRLVYKGRLMDRRHFLPNNGK